jgi:hypothetical protein
VLRSWRSRCGCGRGCCSGDGVSGGGGADAEGELGEGEGGAGVVDDVDLAEVVAGFEGGEPSGLLLAGVS